MPKIFCARFGPSRRFLNTKKMWPDGRGLVPYPALFPLLQNSTVYNPGGNPQMPLPLIQNPTVYNAGGNPQMPLLLPQNPIVYNPGGNPQMPLSLLQNSTVYNPRGSPQVPLPLPQNSIVYNPGGNPQMPLPLLQSPAVYYPGGSAQMPLPLPNNSIVYNPGGNPQMPLPLLQNPTVHNSGGNPQMPLLLLRNSTVYNPGVQNQQGTIFPSYAPHSDQARLASYSQQGRAQDQMAGDQNWHRNRRPLEYQNGEVVMVRCNQQKWLHGLIQRMSAQGLRIWIADADILVNVPLVLVPTHVLKMSMLPKLQGVPPPEPVWTMSFTDETGCRKSLMQCVRPAHLSHRQLFHKFGCMECAICKTTVTSIDVVSPWNCSHQVHNYCLQLRMQHTSTSVCPMCEPPSSGGDDSTLEHVPSTFAGMGPQVPSTSPSNEQPQQWLDLQCACGFRGSIDSACICNLNAPVFCPNCHQPVNVNQSGDLPRAYSDLDREILQRKSVPEQGFGWDTLQSFSGPGRLEAIVEGSREGICSTPPSPDQSDEKHAEPSSILQRMGVPEQEFRWDTLQSFSGLSRLEVIEEGSREGICSTPSSPDQTDEEHAEPASYMPSYLAAFGETFETSVDADPDAAKMQPSPSSLLDDLLTALSPAQFTKGKSSARSSLQDGVLIAPSPSQVTKTKSSAGSSVQDAVFTAPSPPQIAKGKPSVRIALQDDVLTAPSPPQLAKEKPSVRIASQDDELTGPSPPQVRMGKSTVRSSSEDGMLAAPSPPQVTLSQKGKSRTRISFQDDVLTAPSATEDILDEKYSSPRSSLQDDSLYATSSSRSTLIQDDDSANDAQARPEEFQIDPPASTHNQVTVPGADESSVRVLEAETPSLSAPHRQKLFRRASEVGWMKGEINEEREESEEEREEASSSNDFAAIAPSTPPVYVNHFENFVKLAIASASTAKEILASAAASPSSSTTEVLSPWKSPSPAWVSPAPPSAFFTGSSKAVIPVRAFYSRPPALVIEPPSEPVTEGAIIAPAPALFSRVTVPPKLITEGAIVTPAPALFSGAAGMITEAPAWVTKVKDPNGLGPSGDPAWITVIKDGVDSRKEDARQWELDRLARKKEAEFLTTAPAP